jgi:hypothetical protein
MHIRKKLGQLRDDYLTRLDRLEQKFDEVLRLNDPYHEGKTSISYCVIELMNGYRAFNRALLASSMIGARTTLGTRTKIPGVECEYDFIVTVFQALGKRTDPARRSWDSWHEPAWEAVVNNLAERLHLQNEPSISAAFSISGFYKELKVVRNFFCHRCRLLFKEAKSVGLSHLISGSSAEEILLTQKGSGDYLLHHWIYQCRIYAEFSVE